MDKDEQCPFYWINKKINKKILSSQSNNWNYLLALSPYSMYTSKLEQSPFTVICKSRPFRHAKLWSLERPNK